MREEIFEGKTEEDALLKASEALGVNISEMEYEVIEEDPGFFGLFKKSVKVRVRVPERPVAEGKTQVAEIEGTQQEAMPGPKADEAAKVLKGLLERMGVAAEVSCEEDDECIRLNIGSEERDLVIGRDGEVLSALQFVVNKIVNRLPEGRKRVILDANGFRDKRAEDLTRLAERLGQKALRLGRTIKVAGMNAQDRRIIHMALRDKPGLTTRSDGEGIFRYLMIVPSRGEGSRANATRRARRGPRRGRARREQAQNGQKS